jgi:rare lipoprotein A
VPRAEPRSASGNPPFYEVGGHRYLVLASAAGYRERGVASWYGPDFHGLRTATGERYDMFAMTAAHKTLPIPCYARVTNLSNGRSVVVRINDRGPFVSNRIIDLSYTAANRLDMVRNGTAFVEVETLMPAGSGAGSTAELPVTTPTASAASAGLSSVPPVTAPLQPAAVPPVSPAPPPATAAAVPVTPPAPATAPVAMMSRFYIQVGAYAQPENARRAAQKLRDAGLDHVSTLPPAPDQPLQRVRIGPIASVQEFDQLIARLSALGFPAARLAQD